MEIKEGIIPILMGGLGNQMFCLSAGYVISKTHNLPLFLHYKERYMNKHNIFNIDYRENIFKEFGTCIDLTEYAVKVNIPYLEIQKEGAFSSWNPNTKIEPPFFFINNYFQYYPPLAPFEKEIRYLFCKGIEDYKKAAKEKIKNPLESGFLHVRRGDYLNNPSHFIQPLTYYESAVKNLLEKKKNIKTIYIFSDDIEWISQQDFFKQPIYKIINIENEVHALAFMSECKGGAICANSTFSWWGAFLGAYEYRNPIIVPEKWVPEPIISLFPPEWIII